LVSEHARTGSEWRELESVYILSEDVHQVNKHLDMAAAPSTTTGSLDFYVPPKDGARAYQSINAQAETGIRDRNFSLENHQVEIHNLRGNESAATLDTAGFQLFKHPAKHTAFANDTEIEKEYYPESIELIKKLTGASRVVLFDHSASPCRISWRMPISPYIFPSGPTPAPGPS
jgi:hypothetical protein